MLVVHSSDTIPTGIEVSGDRLGLEGLASVVEETGELRAISRHYGAGGELSDGLLDVVVGDAEGPVIVDGASAPSRVEIRGSVGERMRLADEIKDVARAPEAHAHAHLEHYGPDSVLGEASWALVIFKT